VENLTKEIKFYKLHYMEGRIKEQEQKIHVFGKHYEKKKMRTNNPAFKPYLANKTQG
jgi:hypothetical protein